MKMFPEPNPLWPAKTAVTRETVNMTKCLAVVCSWLEKGGGGTEADTRGPQHSWCLWDMVAGLSPAPGPS